MKKAELVKAVAKDAGITIAEAAEAVNSVFDNIKKALLSGDSYTVERFASFSVVQRAERMGRNPQTNEQIKIAPQKAMKVKTALAFKSELNGKNI